MLLPGLLDFKQNEPDKNIGLVLLFDIILLSLWLV
ncbi:hypothetical protein ATK78_0547 [Pedobacter metabolipauper]|uniref:Uncharacterized protein n=1 Tax=Pedobacter metabolipauper TaxID=425513 RepID=A0A4R6SZF2_9SPHI|nr:hypothetical protein ATK78_0547 [Pedobacter metabolipauper]